MAIKTIDEITREYLNDSAKSATDMHGFSGGAKIDLGRIGPDTLAAAFEPKLAGLFIEGHGPEKVLLRTRVSAILTAVRLHLTAAAAAPAAAPLDDGR